MKILANCAISDVKITKIVPSMEGPTPGAAAVKVHQMKGVDLCWSS
jgi:hypothetical protein